MFSIFSKFGRENVVKVWIWICVDIKGMYIIFYKFFGDGMGFIVDFV